MSKSYGKTRSNTNGTTDCGSTNTTNSKSRNKSNARRNKGRNINASMSGGASKGVTDVSAVGTNDPSWYFDNRELMDSVSQFSFNDFVGHTSQKWAHTARGAMVIYFNPAAGSVATGDDDEPRLSALNMSMRKLYTTLSSGSGKTTQYTPDDLGILLLSLGSLIEMVEYGRRAFGLAFTYNQRNWFYPKDIIRDAGFSDILDDLANKRMNFNVAINTINKISFPMNIGFFAKCFQMYQNVYLDTPSPMAQSYIYKPYSYWVLDETSNPKGSQLVTKPLKPNMTFKEYLAILDEMTNAIMLSSTYNYIYGDVLNYADKHSVPLFHINLLAEDYAITPVYNQNALLQIHNLTAIGAPINAEVTAHSHVVNTISNNVVANVEEARIEYAPAFAIRYMMADNLLIDSIDPSPSVEDRIDMTRFTARCGEVYETASYKPAGGQETQVKVAKRIALPDHYVVAIGFGTGAFSDTFIPNPVWDASQWDRTVFLSGVSQFDWAPIVYAQNDEGTSFTVHGDLNFFTTIDCDYLYPVNELAYQGLFELR